VGLSILAVLSVRALLMLTMLATAVIAAAPGKRATVELQRWPTMLTVEPVPEDVIAIRDAPWKEAATRTPGAAVALASTSWTVAWDRPFGRESTIVALTAVNGKLFSMSGDGNLLLDIEGKPVLDPMPRMMARGRPFADSAKDRVFVSGDGVQELVGEKVRTVSPLPGFSSTLVVNGDRLLAYGSIAGGHPHGGPVTRTAAIAIADLADSHAHAPKVVANGISDIAVATTPESIAFVLPDEIHLLPWDFSKGVVLKPSEKFTPLSAAFDDAGRLYLVAAVEKRVELWIVERDGRRRLRTALPLTRVAGTPDAWATHEVFRASAPLIGRHGHIYLETWRRSHLSAAPDAFLFAIAPSGSLAWTRDLAGNGGAVLEGDRLLVSDRGSLLSLDAAGAATVLFDSPDALTGPPVLVREDAIALATSKKVFLLRRN